LEKISVWVRSKGIVVSKIKKMKQHQFAIDFFILSLNIFKSASIYRFETPSGLIGQGLSLYEFSSRSEKVGLEDVTLSIS
jgi:hypothetical protein